MHLPPYPTEIANFSTVSLSIREAALYASRHATVKPHILKAKAQLQQKEETGGVLDYIDFHQLQIKKNPYVRRIEERNKALLQLKMTTGKTVQTRI